MGVIQFKKATKTQSRLRLSIAGPAGSGKTYTSLRIAAAMGGKVAVIDTERGSASKYADQFDFDVIELSDFHPERYIEAMRAAGEAGYSVLVIDSTTHEWNGKNGILELHEQAVARQKTKNSYTAWAEITPIHNKFIDAILQSPCHVIATVRSKTEYVQDKDDRGRTEIRKVGMAAIQRDGMDYEYDIAMELSLDHVGVIGKTRCAALDGRVFKLPGEEFAGIVNAWLSDGAPAPEKPLAIAQESRTTGDLTKGKGQSAPAAEKPATANQGPNQAAFVAIWKRLRTIGIADMEVQEQIKELADGRNFGQVAKDADAEGTFAALIPHFESWAQREEHLFTQENSEAAAG